MRGEHSARSPLPQSREGSSPHARGARLRRGRGLHAGGIIPACAGSTRPAGAGSRTSWDHPRMRGEHRSLAAIAASPAGSSPHARGAPSLIRCWRASARIIPACAGSTRRWGCTGGRRRDHPRMRGEHLLSAVDSHRCPGSSPHARGARTFPLTRLPAARIIPACAGSTRNALGRHRWRRDHPRMRGEH